MERHCGLQLWSVFSGVVSTHQEFLNMCLQAFCWLCGHATGYQHTWSEIADHSCGRYKEEADKRIGEAQRSNKRYQHYCLRWWVHLTPSHLLETCGGAPPVRLHSRSTSHHFSIAPGCSYPGSTCVPLHAVT